MKSAGIVLAASLAALATAPFLAVALLQAQAQTAPTPEPAGPAAVLVWNPNPPEQRVTNYNVYAVGSAGAFSLSTPTNGLLLTRLITAPGIYDLRVRAVNAAGESDPSAPVRVGFWGDRPSPPQGARMTNATATAGGL